MANFFDLDPTQTKSSDGKYIDLVFTGLVPDTDYGFTFAWVYEDASLGISGESNIFDFKTIEEPELAAPYFIEENLDAINSILYVTWNGKDATNSNYLEGKLKQVNIWIKGGDFGEEYKQYATSFTKAGTIQISATKKATYCVKLQAEGTTAGKLSPFSSEFCITLLEQPDPVYDVRHEWVKRDLVMYWKFDPTITKNALADSFAVQLIADSKDLTKFANVDKAKIPPLEHKIVFPEADLAAIFGQVTAFQTDYNSFIYVRDKNLQTSTVVGYLVSAYVDPLTAPVISVIKGPMSYNVSFTNNSEFDRIYIEDSTDGGVTWVDRGSSSSNPVYVGTTNSLTRQVRARFSKIRGGLTGYSNIVSVTPDKLDPTDTTPPDPIVNPTAAWSGSNFVVSFAMPAQNVPTDVKIYLTYSGSTKLFEKPISTSTPSANTSVTIFKSEIEDAWAADPLSFSAGYVTALDFYRNENTTQVSISNISSVVKSNALSGQVTTISVSAAANGYVVSSNLPSSATGISIYQSSSENGSYALVASSNSSPVVVYDEANAGNTVWVKGQWTSSTGNASISTSSSVQILDVGALSLIENTVKIKTDGSIFAGTLDANNDPVLAQARMIINKRGLFLYDDNDANGTNPTTQIIGKWDATNTNAPATFITQKAKIGNWIVSSDKFENVLSPSTNIYTGLSPSGTYAFWAGAGVSGGYSTDITKDAKFSVNHSGDVIARNIKILGGEMQVGSKFTVDTNGKITATDVMLTGEITAERGTIKGNLNILQAGSLIARPSDTEPASSNRVTLNSAGIFAYDIGGAETTQIISNAAANAPTFITDRARIGNWTVAPNTISSGNITLRSGSTAGDTSIIATNAGGYVGIKPKSSLGSEIVLWAGTVQSPGPNDGSGATRAGFQVNADGQLYATGAIISGKITVESGSSLGGLLADTSKIYAQNDEPTGGTYKTGDAWVDTNDSNKVYIYDSTKVTGSKWVLAQDSASAKDVANAKRIIVSATQLLSPLRPNFTPANGVSFAAGDAWYNTSDGNKLYIYNGATWILTQDSGIADGIAAKASLQLRLGDGTDLALLKSLIVNTDGAHIYSSFSDANNEIKTKSSYDSDSTPGFFIGWHKPVGQNKIWPAMNIGTASSYMKFSSYSGVLEIKGNIRNGLDSWNADGSFTFGGDTGIKKGTTGKITIGSNVDILGTVTATSLETPNLDIATDGTITTQSGKFGVSSGGVLSATGASLTNGSLTITSGTKTTTVSSNATISLVDTSTGGWDSGGAISISAKRTYAGSTFGAEDVSANFGANQISLSRAGTFQSNITHADELSGVSRGDLLIQTGASSNIVLQTGSPTGKQIIMNSRLNAVYGITPTYISGATTWNSTSIRNITVSNSAPSGGSEGEIWIQI